MQETLYIVTYGEYYEYTYILGVYSTKELAEEAIKNTAFRSQVDYKDIEVFTLNKSQLKTWS